MNKKISKKTAPKQSSPLHRLYIGLGLLIVAVIAVLLILLLPDKKSVVQDENSSYRFEKHGTASFLDNKGNQICTFDIEIADTIEKQTIGLMYRDSLATNQGMLFPYDNEEIRSFWMKNTYLPLDIIYISADSSIVSIAANTTPFNEEALQSEAPAQFVLEINAGLSAGLNLQPGVKFSYHRD